MTKPASTAEVAATSDRLSIAVALSTAESILSPIFRLKKHIHSFTNMEIPSTAGVIQEKLISSGWKILSREVFASSTPMSTIIKDTISRPHTRFCVAERMLVVGRLAGHLKAQKADDAGASVGQVIDAVGNNRNRAGQKPRGDFGGAEQGVAENTHNAAYHAVSLPHSRAFHVRRVGNKVFYEEISKDGSS